MAKGRFGELLLSSTNVQLSEYPWLRMSGSSPDCDADIDKEKKPCRRKSSSLGTDLPGDRVEVTLALRRDAAPVRGNEKGATGEQEADSDIKDELMRRKTAGGQTLCRCPL